MEQKVEKARHKSSLNFRNRVCKRRIAQLKYIFSFAFEANRQNVTWQSRAVNTCQHHKITHAHVLFRTPTQNTHSTFTVGFSVFVSQNIHGTRPFIPTLCSCGICNKKCYFILLYLFSCLGFSINSDSSSGGSTRGRSNPPKYHQQHVSLVR